MVEVNDENTEVDDAELQEFVPLSCRFCNSEQLDHSDHYFFVCPWASQIWIKAREIYRRLDPSNFHRIADWPDTARLFCWQAERQTRASQRFSRRLGLWHGAVLTYLYNAREELRHALFRNPALSDARVARMLSAQLQHCVVRITLDIARTLEDLQSAERRANPNRRRQKTFQKTWCDENLLIGD